MLSPQLLDPFNLLSITRFATAVSAVFSGRQLIVAVTNTDSTRTITLATRLMTDDFGARLVIIKDESGGALTNNITVATEGSETIDGAASVAIDANYGILYLYSDRSNWYILNKMMLA
jgi:hypothetical protein